MCVQLSVDYRVFDTTNIIDVRKYLMKKHNIKQCLVLLKKAYQSEMYDSTYSY